MEDIIQDLYCSDDNTKPREFRRSESEIRSQFIWSSNELAKECFGMACEAGFFDRDRDNCDGEGIAFMHLELSGALVALQNGNPPSEHLPEFSLVEEELADVIIRIMYLAYERGWRVNEALTAKMAFQQTRLQAHKHRKQF